MCVLRPHVEPVPNSHAAFFIEAVLASASGDKLDILPLPVESYPPDALGGAAGWRSSAPSGSPAEIRNISRCLHVRGGSNEEN